MPLVRLDAEALYDTLLLVAGPSGRDSVRSGGRGPGAPRRPCDAGRSARGWRRLVYVRQTRKQIATHLETFDFPPMNPNCLERRDSTVAPQALHLMNNGMVDQLAEQFAQRVSREGRD